jgi:DNA-binding NtrC family response regulator
VLSDLGLPKLSGDQMFSEMKNVNPDIKVIIATGYIDLEKKETLFKHGIKNILHKPLQMNELLKSVREVLDLK